MPQERKPRTMIASLKKGIEAGNARIRASISQKDSEWRMKKKARSYGVTLNVGRCSWQGFIGFLLGAPEVDTTK